MPNQPTNQPTNTAWVFSRFLRLIVLFLIICLIPQQAHADLRNGLVGWWKFDEMSGNAVDSSAYANTGTPSGTTITQNCIRSGCRSFNGTGDYISIPSSANYDSTTSTWCVWFKTAGGFGLGTGVTNAVLLGRHNAVGSLSGTNLSMATSGLVGFDAKDSSGNYPFALTTAAIYADNNWHQACAIAAPNGSTASLYMDGSLISSTTSVRTWAFNNQAVRIGDSTDTFWGQYKGFIDEVRIYNRALSAQEIHDLYIPGIVLRNGVVRNGRINQ